ncbi:hypothetical protein M7I_8099 [Glarea lozoyensis 74030]|uniref:Uncharacterized protein n=1 Tax=Glarea lozoyensis (strain ATCC 74030 / MF5533) TaxID=1104152 RepID=H0EZ37_GLAL7|nr:hypothetical protein M7I_8099 [Glarea lozoyensis 74030]
MGQQDPRRHQRRPYGSVAINHGIANQDIPPMIKKGVSNVSC